MSFALTTRQILDGSQDVTRRLGWVFLKPGELVRPVRKCMGLRPGEQLDVLRDPIRVVSIRREPLRQMLDDVEYGFEEVRREGFAWHPDYSSPGSWIAMFCATHKGCTPETVITRIEFAYGVET
ncbi:hypothetical protein J7E70_01910 [Variovorax paradoxus]|nr:hypothetical protein [Variovorax paradoxus]MBT2299210.1 hypothetical protein [Variovorax paradoxus]